MLRAAVSVQPDSSKTLSKGFSGVVGRIIKSVAVIGLSGALGKSLTSGLQDHVQRLPPRRGPQLEGLGEVVLGGYPAEEGFFFLELRQFMLAGGE
jgi:hypothetical protein